MRIISGTFLAFKPKSKRYDLGDKDAKFYIFEAKDMYKIVDISIEPHLNNLLTLLDLTVSTSTSTAQTQP